MFQQDGSNDIVNQFGSWPEANKAMAAALEEKGYDHKFVFGEGAHSGSHGTAIFPDAMRWMWRDYPKDYGPGSSDGCQENRIMYVECKASAGDRGLVAASAA